MTRDLVFEIGTEEIPAAYMPNAIRDMEALAREKLSGANLSFGSLRTMGTPRRLVLYVYDLAENQAGWLKEVRGPKREQAFDAEGRPTSAALGFARAQGVTVESLEVREMSGVDYVFAVKKESGKKTVEVLPGVLREIVVDLGFPKAMRWAYSEFRFARPIRWMLALLGNEVIPVQIENVEASNVTFGHRFLSERPITVNEAANYFELMEKAFVVVDHERRRQMIWEQILNTAEQAGGYPYNDEELLEEVNFLLEYPAAFYGKFSPEYLVLPTEVLTTTMIEHQRYFPVFSDDGKLLPGFIGVRNGDEYNLEKVKAGNERVLRARLEDALFFYREDTKQPLASKVELLKNVVYQARLGTVWSKVERLQDIAVFIGKETGLGRETTIRRAAYLCKADLETNMVYEFPELQGIMVRYYALASGEDPEVAEAILEHYLPRFAGDRLPETSAGIAVSLAEKLDNLVGCFCINIKPSGSQDPYALRRQALGLVNIILKRGLRLDLEKAIRFVYQGFAPIKPDLSCEETVGEVLDFVLQRLRGILSDSGISYDVLDAVLAVPQGDVLEVRKRAEALQEFKQSEYFEDGMVVFNRCYNSAKKWDNRDVDEVLLETEAERRVYQWLAQTEPLLNELKERGEYGEYLITLSKGRAGVDELFDAVMIMAEDPKLRKNRLSLLRRISDSFLNLGDFSRLV